MTHALLKKLVLGFALVLLLGVRAPAQAEILYGSWMKLKVQVKGMQVEDDGSLKKGSSKSVSYMQFLPLEAEGGSGFGYNIWSETSPGTWEIVDGGEYGGPGDPDLLCIDWFMGFTDAKGAFYGGYMVCTIKIKTDKEGALKSATLKTLGGECTDASLDGEHLFGGSIKVSGKTVPESKLPFSVKMPV